MEHENILAVTKINGYLNNCLEDIHEINILLNESQFSCHLMLKEKLMSCQDNFRKIKEQIKSTDNECPQVHKFVASDDSNNNNIVAQSNNIQVYHIVFCQYNIQQKSLTVTFNNSAHQNKAQRKNSGMMVKKYSKINLAEDIQKCCKKERQNESDLLEKMKEFMLQQLKIHRDLHKTQLVSLCDEISMKQSMIEYLMFEKEKQEETGKGWNLKDWMWFRRIHATQDIKLLEESLAQEIQKLHNLRKSIVAEANNGIRKSKNNPELECLSNEGKKHIISVLENNLVHLTREQNEVSLKDIYKNIAYFLIDIFLRQLIVNLL